VGSVSATTLVTFDGAAATTFKWNELNDPVMGGKSTGTWSVNSTGQFGVFDGDVVDVPSLKAPGFIKSAADGKFVNVADQISGDLVLMVRSSTPEYKGFRVSFAAGTMSPSYSCAGGGSLPFSRGCFKAKFSVPAGDDFAPIRVPFNTFSDLWSPATGEQTKTCAQDKDACPTMKSLAKIIRIEVWAEGVAGKAHLEIQSISAEASRRQALNKVSSLPPADQNTCKGPVQKKLRYGISGRSEATVPIPVDANETLADAVCCDKRMSGFAEPQFLFQAPDINLFAKMDASGVTTFYDSVCGVPVFKTPVNRTFADFEADTNEHGWPSFRDGEVFHENVKTDKTTTYVTSVCGTHLGSYLPDAQGSRWCIDLSCISGNEMENW
jgi:peptide methionine sulfoxide reductase MsrB